MDNVTFAALLLALLGSGAAVIGAGSIDAASTTPVYADASDTTSGESGIGGLARAFDFLAATPDPRPIAPDIDTVGPAPRWAFDPNVPPALAVGWPNW